MKKQRTEGHESELVLMLKKQGFVAVRSLHIYGVCAELANLSMMIDNHQYKDFRIVPIEAVLKEGYEFSGQVSHVVYATFEKPEKKRDYVAMGQIRNKSGKVSVRPL
jgi:hypothetical protein